MGQSAGHVVSTFAILGCLTSLLVFLSPVFTFTHIYIKKSTGVIDSLPFVVTFSSTIFWVYYGIVSDNLPILITNSIGSSLELTYIAMYVYYAAVEFRIRTLKRLALSVAAPLTAIILTLLLTKGYYRIKVVGWVSTTSSLLVFLSPTYDIIRVVKTRDFRHMSFWLSFALTWSGVAWTTYGVVRYDYSVTIPNAIGLGLGICQMVVYGIVRATHPHPSDTVDV